VKLQQYTGQFKFLLIGTGDTTVFENVTMQIDANCTIDIIGLSASFDLSGTPYAFPCSDSAFLTDQVGTLTVIVPSVVVGYAKYKTVAYHIYDSKLGDRILFGRLGMTEGMVLPIQLPVFEVFSLVGLVSSTELNVGSPRKGVYT